MHYPPFGMQMPGRGYSAGSGYRYGFNGKEKDNEVKGEGNQQDYGIRVYDPRLGRFLSVDPISREYPFYSPYHFAGNTPIRAFDLDGLEVTFSDVWNNKATLADWVNDPTTWTSGAQTFNEVANPIYQAFQHGWEIWNARDYYTGLPKTRANAVGETGADVVAWLTGERLLTSVGRAGNVMERQMLKNAAAMGQAEKSAAQKAAQNLTNKELKNTVTFSSKNEVAFGKDIGTNLLDFSKKVNASYFRNWHEKLGVPHGLSFEDQFSFVTQKVINSGGRIHFNLDNVSVIGAKRIKGTFYEAIKKGRGTEWELNKILNNNSLKSNTDFYLNGKVMTGEQLSKLGIQ